MSVRPISQRELSSTLPSLSPPLLTDTHISIYATLYKHVKTQISSSLSLSAMATIPSDEEITYPGIANGICSQPAATTCFELFDPSLELDGLNQHPPLDVLPIVVEKAPAPVQETCTTHNSSGQDTYNIAMLSAEGNTSPNCTLPLAFLSFLEVPITAKSQMSIDPLANKQSFIDLQMKSEDAYSSCIMDIDIGIENYGKSKPEDEAFGNAKSEGLVTGVLHRQTSLKACGKFMEIVANHGSPLLNLISREKSFNERVHETPSNRWRKCKRAASFDSRKIVLLFSILSSVGTLILIYLTLRVRQAADSFVSV